MQLYIYETSGEDILAMPTGKDRDGKISVVNEAGAEVALPKERLYVIAQSFVGGLPELPKIKTEGVSKASNINVNEVWELVGPISDLSILELAELYYSTPTPSDTFALFTAITGDKVYFAREGGCFTARDEATVEKLKVAAIQKKEREEVCLAAFNLLGKTQSDIKPEVKNRIRMLEKLAADAPGSATNDATHMLEVSEKQLGLKSNGPLRQRAFDVLIITKHFHPDQNLAQVKYNIRVNQLELPGDLLHVKSSDTLKDKPIDCLSIDDQSTRDIDDGLSIEQTSTGFKVGIHIANVAAVDFGTLEDEVRKRATSVYFPEKTIHMLPESLSTEALSLVPNAVRSAISCIVDISDSGKILSYEIQRTSVKNVRRLTYDQVDDLLEKQDRDLSNLYNIAAQLETARIMRGAIKQERSSAAVYVNSDYTFEVTPVDEEAPSRLLVSEMMVLANTLFAEFAAKNKLPFIYRVQEGEGDHANSEEFGNKVQAKDPMQSQTEGSSKENQDDNGSAPRLKPSSFSTYPREHAAMAVAAYAQVTSPIRRYLDLLNQRQLLALIEGKPPKYTNTELNSYIERTQDMLKRAKLSSNEAKQYWLIKYLERFVESREPISATVVRTDLRKPIVELDYVFITVPCDIRPAPQVGTQIKVRILAVKPREEQVRIECVQC